ncbi:unnamed protein product [Calypogeia fissa]
MALEEAESERDSGRESERESDGGEEQASGRETTAEVLLEESVQVTKKTKKKLVPVKKGKTGVCYLSRIPPHLKPLKLRFLLSQFAEVSRVYLVPEDAAARIRRKRAGGNSGKNFTEGWVEFVHKRDAKKVAAALNGEPMDQRKRSAYHYDLWNIKYLHKFKWDNLTGEMAYKKAVREQKLAVEISAAKKERDFYLSRVDQARAISSMEERKRKRKDAEKTEAETASPGLESVEKNAKKSRFLRHFNQRRSVADPVSESQPGLPLDVLGAVFGKPSK